MVTTPLLSLFLQPDCEQSDVGLTYLVRQMPDMVARLVDHDKVVGEAIILHVSRAYDRIGGGRP